MIKRVVAELIDDKGIDGLILEDVCARTELTIGAFYFHFVNKDAAVEEVAVDSLDSYYVSLIEAPESLTLYGEIHGILEASMEMHLDHPKIAGLMYAMVPRSRRVYTHWLEVRDRLVERLVSAIAKEKKRGEGAEDPPGVMSQNYLHVQFLLAGAEGFFENAMYGSDPQFEKIDLDPANLVRDLSLIWYRAICGASPRGNVVQQAHDTFAEKLRATRRPRRSKRATRSG